MQRGGRHHGPLIASSAAIPCRGVPAVGGAAGLPETGPCSPHWGSTGGEPCVRATIPPHPVAPPCPPHPLTRRVPGHRVTPARRARERPRNRRAAGPFEPERVTGIEPAYQAWEACVLPLNYTRVFAGQAPCRNAADSFRRTAGERGVTASDAVYDTPRPPRDTGLVGPRWARPARSGRAGRTSRQDLGRGTSAAGVAVPVPQSGPQRQPTTAVPIVSTAERTEAVLVFPFSMNANTRRRPSTP